MVINNMIQNSPIISYAITNAPTTFVTNLAGTRVKKVQQNPDRVVMDYIDAPKYFLKLHKFITLVTDVMFVNSSPLLITMPHGIKFVTVEHISTRTDKPLSKY